MADQLTKADKLKPVRVTFRKRTNRVMFRHLEDVSVRIGGKDVGVISYCQQRGRHYWYATKHREQYNSLWFEGSATDLDGCKAECRAFFRSQPESV
jgi:hypothetical protein